MKHMSATNAAVPTDAAAQAAALPPRCSRKMPQQSPLESQLCQGTMFGYSARYPQKTQRLDPSSPRISPMCVMAIYQRPSHPLIFAPDNPLRTREAPHPTLEQDDLHTLRFVTITTVLARRQCWKDEI